MKIQTKRSAAFVQNLFANIPLYINGTLNDTYGVGKVFWTTITREMFRKIHDSYEARSLGGADDLGNIFTPLAQNTIAQRPIGRGNLKGLGLTKKQSGTAFGDRERGLLSPEENRAWKRKYSIVLSQLMRRISETRAKQIAAAVAWNYVKSKGARTKKAVLGNRNVLIMRVTDSIFDSLEPTEGSATSYRKRKSQIVEIDGKTLTLGSSVDHARFHDKTRPAIPENADLWVDEIVEMAMENIQQHLIDTVL